MPGTTRYSYTIAFDRGTAEVTDKHHTGPLCQVAWRAKYIIPEQRKVVYVNRKQFDGESHLMCRIE